MRLSPFHIQLAKEFALGKKNSDLLLTYQISPSRLSVIKANPLFKQEIERQRTILDDKYGKAVEVLENAAEKVAQELVVLVQDKTINADVRSRTAENILDRVAMKTGAATKQSSNEVVFEQLLRVTKRATGDTSDDTELSFDPEAAYQELMSDLTTSTEPPEVINITPTPTFTKQLPTNTPMPALGDNGGTDKGELSPRLKALLASHKPH